MSALGSGFPAQLALWRILARVLDQGSRLCAVRLAQLHGATGVLGIRRGFDENGLHTNPGWLSEQQEIIGKRLFTARRGSRQPGLFLHGVTSNYLEGGHNALGAYGYNSNGKKGKKQIAAGLLCDGQSEPVSTGVFRGKIQTPATFAPQVKKAGPRFGCQRVTFAGDRGTNNSAQIEDSTQVRFHCFTAITKPRIETLLKAGELQMALFDSRALLNALDIHPPEVPPHSDTRAATRKNLPGRRKRR